METTTMKKGASRVVTPSRPLYSRSSQLYDLITTTAGRAFDPFYRFIPDETGSISGKYVYETKFYMWRNFRDHLFDSPDFADMWKSENVKFALGVLNVIIDELENSKSMDQDQLKRWLGGTNITEYLIRQDESNTKTLTGVQLLLATAKTIQPREDNLNESQITDIVVTLETLAFLMGVYSNSQ